ncbi:hypothetical protein AVEN_55586-1, partial [Araneus ventricosus]
WQLCYITFDDDDVSEPPYGENPTLDSDDYGKKPVVNILDNFIISLRNTLFNLKFSATE